MVVKLLTGEYIKTNILMRGHYIYYMQFEYFRMINKKKELGETIEEVNRQVSNFFKKVFDKLETSNQTNKYRFRISYLAIKKIYNENNKTYSYMTKPLSKTYFNNRNNFNLPSLDDYEDFEHIHICTIYRYINADNLSGGTSKYNNCCINIIKKQLKNNEKNKKIQRSKYIKQLLNINENDEVKIEHIPQLEKITECNINVFDKKKNYLYMSKGNYNFNVNMKLHNNHYNYICNTENYKNYTIPTETTLNLFYEKNNLFVVYNEYETTEKKERPKNTLENVYIRCKTNDIITEYNEIIENNEIIKKITNNKIDLSLCRWKINNAIFNNLYNMGLKNVIFDDMNEIEEIFITNCYNSGLIYYENIEGNFKCLDYNSYYASIMRNPKFLIPISKPEIRKITQFEFNNMKFIEFGIYRAIIYIENKKLIMENKKNYYTYQDMKRAIELNYKIVIIEDGEPNFLYYKKKINGFQLFKKYVDYFYHLKISNPEHKDIIKPFLTNVWGYLSSINYYYKTTNNNNEDVIINNEDDIINIYHIRDNIHKIKLLDKKHHKFNYCRIKPFITSFGRYYLSKTINNYVDNIHRIYIDGFYVDENINFITGSNIGDLKEERKGYFIINGLKKPELIN